MNYSGVFSLVLFSLLQYGMSTLLQTKLGEIEGVSENVGGIDVHKFLGKSNKSIPL